MSFEQNHEGEVLEHILPSVRGGYGVLIPGSTAELGPRAGPVLLHLVVGVGMTVRLSVALAVEESRVRRVTVAITVTITRAITVAVTVSGGEREELGLWMRPA